MTEGFSYYRLETIPLLKQYFRASGLSVKNQFQVNESPYHRMSRTIDLIEISNEKEILLSLE